MPDVRPFCSRTGGAPAFARSLNGILAQSSLFDLTQALVSTPGVRLLDQQFSTTREGLVRSSATSSYEVSVSTPAGFFAPVGPNTSEFASTSYHAVAVGGADASLALTSHLALVPQVRADALNGGLSLRLGAGLRWTF